MTRRWSAHDVASTPQYPTSVHERSSRCRATWSPISRNLRRKRGSVASSSFGYRLCDEGRTLFSPWARRCGNLFRAPKANRHDRPRFSSVTNISGSPFEIGSVRSPGLLRRECIQRGGYLRADLGHLRNEVRMRRSMIEMISRKYRLRMVQARSPAKRRD